MPGDSALRTLLVDDEPLAIARLQALCADLEEVMVVGSATDGQSALALVDALQPDLVLLDICMPGVDGMTVAARLADHPHRCAVVFCTASADFAVAAFDLSAADYVLKPVSPERLARALERVRRQRAAAPRFAGEVWVPFRGEMLRVPVNDIDRIDAERDYVRLHVGPRAYLLHHTLSALADRLDPAAFLRLHRSTIVRWGFVSSLRHDGPGVWSAVLADGAAVRVSRTHLATLKDLLRSRSGRINPKDRADSAAG